MHLWAILMILCDCLLLSARLVVEPVELGVEDGSWMHGGGIPQFSWFIPSFRKIFWDWALGVGLSQHYWPSFPSLHHSSQTLSGREFSASFLAVTDVCLVSVQDLGLSYLPLLPWEQRTFVYICPLIYWIFDSAMEHGRGFPASFPHGSLKLLLHLREWSGEVDGHLCCPEWQPVISWYLYLCSYSSPMLSVLFTITLLQPVRQYGSFLCLGSPGILNCHVNPHPVFENS